jgi:hypothetical protein
MKLLSTIIYGGEILYILALILVQIWFFRLFPAIRLGWSGISLMRRMAFVLLGILSAGCLVVLLVGTHRTFTVMRIKGVQRVKYEVQSQLYAVESLLSIYWIETGELPSGSDRDIWQTILNHDHLNQTWARYENKYLATSDEGALVDHWDTPIRFQLVSDSVWHLYSAGFDRKFSTADDIPKKWEPTGRRSHLKP